MIRFQDEYGDMFVRGLQTGGLFFGVIQIFTKDRTDKESVQVRVSASYAAFSGSGTFDQAFKDTVSSRQTIVKCYIEGGDDTKPLPTSVDTMTDRATHFPSDLLEGRGVPYAALLDSYSILPLPNPPNYIDLQHQKDVLIECARLRNQDLMALNDIDYIMHNPDEFIDVDTYPLSQLRHDLSDDLNIIAATASDALNNPKRAKLPDLKTGAIILPRRKAAPIIPLGTLVTIPDVRGIETRAAEAKLAELGLLNERVLITNGNNDSPPTGDVAIQSPPGGTQVPVGETVVLTIEMNEMNT